ncbi:MAG: hypothetical protein V1709_09455 [Planctomycetota bacterium]
MKIPFLKYIGKLFSFQVAEEVKSLELTAELDKGNIKITANNNRGIIIIKDVGMTGELKDGAELRLSDAVEKYLEAKLAKRIDGLKSPNLIKVADMVVNTSASGAISSMEYIKGDKDYEERFLDD